MSVSAISSSILLGPAPKPWQSQVQQFQQAFQQIGQDLQAGNLTAAQTDFANLQQSRFPSPALSWANNPQRLDPLSQALDQLSQDLKSGNVAAAQKDLTTVQQDLQSTSAGHHHHHIGGAGSTSAIAQEFAQLGQALNGGNLSAAQQAYNLLGQDLPFGQDGNLLTPATSSTNSGLSLTA